MIEETEIKRGPGRPPRAEMRPDVRDDDPRARAAKRAAEIREHLGGMDEGTDKFFIDPKDVPDGWSYEWKMKTVLGAENPAYQVNLARRGWEAVPASRHPSYMPEGSKGVIERDGMILMERPLELTDESRRHEYKKARDQVRQKEEQLTGSRPGEFERSNKGQPMANVKHSYEPIQIPKE